jgi:hypothetical protein
MEALEAGEGVGPSCEGSDDGVSGVFDVEWGVAAAAVIDDAERWLVAF